MGNSTSQSEAESVQSVESVNPESVQSVESVNPEQLNTVTEVTHANNESNSDSDSDSSNSQSPVPVPKKNSYVHPLIDMLYKSYSQSEMIGMLEAFCGVSTDGYNDAGQEMFDSVDQTEFIAPVLQVFSHCANNGKTNVVEWILKNFVPLQVSYDNNYIFFECIKWKHYHVAKMILNHESFNPTPQVFEYRVDAA